MPAQIVVVPKPAAAADWAYTIPTTYGSGVILISVSALFTTSGTVANRIPNLTLLNGPSGAGTILSAGIAGALTATQSARYLWGMGLPALAAPVNSATTPSTFPVPQGIMVPPGGIIASITAAIAAGDQWSDIVLVLAQ